MDIPPQKILKDYTFVHDACKHVANEISKLIEENSNTPIKQIIPIARGGLVPATIISHLTNVPIKCAIQAQSYKAYNQQEIKFSHVIPALTLEEQRSTLIVDDIIDSGNTLAAVAHYYPRCSMAALVSKGKVDEEYLPGIRKFVYKNTPKDCWIVFPWEVS